MKRKLATSQLQTEIHEIILDCKRGKYGSGHAAALIVRKIKDVHQRKTRCQYPTLMDILDEQRADEISP